MAAAGCWTLAQLNWLSWAYQLEFKGKACFVQVHFSSLAFFGASIYGAVMTLHSFQAETSFYAQLQGGSKQGGKPELHKRYSFQRLSGSRS